MKKILTLILALFLVAALAVSVSAENMGLTYSAPYGTITVGGEIDVAWDAAAWSALTAGNPNGPPTAQIKVMHDDTWVYVLAQFNDVTGVKNDENFTIGAKIDNFYYSWILNLTNSSNYRTWANSPNGWFEIGADKNLDYDVIYGEATTTGTLLTWEIAIKAPNEITAGLIQMEFMVSDYYPADYNGPEIDGIKNGYAKRWNTVTNTGSYTADEPGTITLMPKSCAHTGGTATCIEKAVCTICTQPYGELAQHTPGDYVTTDPTYHWHACTVCTEPTDEKQLHIGEGTCETCGATFEPIKNGLIDGRFYENNTLITNYRIYEYENATYFIDDNNRIAKNKVVYLTNGAQGWEGATGFYAFGADGKLYGAGSGNIVCGIYAFTDGVQVKAYGAFETRDGDWYFVNDGYRIATNKAFRIQLPGEASLRYHYFGVDGKLYTEDPVMFGDRIYIDGIQQGYGLYLAYEVKADGTLADEAKYYYVNDHHIIARDKRLYVNSPELGNRGYYYFDINGHIVLE